MSLRSRVALPLALLLLPACASVLRDDRVSFLEEAGWLEQQVGARLVLSGTGGFVYAPALQGRVMTSAVDLSEPGLGLVNRPVIEDPDAPAPFHNYGGEDRFWVGPEGGKFSFYFDPGAPFELEHWRTPTELDIGAYDEVAFGRLERRMVLSNRAGTEFTLDVARQVSAPEQAEVEEVVGAIPPGTLWTAFRTVNQVTNAGDEAWTRAGGLPSIWLAGMFLPGERAWAVLPFRTDREDPDGGPAVRSGPEYFAPLDDKRLRVGDGVAVFKVDSDYKSKVGILAKRAVPVVGAYDPATRVLTVIRFGPIVDGAPYVPHAWGEQGDPYYGDVVNSYNSVGEPGFFELESSSPGLELAPGESHTHTSTTMHFRFADEAQLAAAAEAAFGVPWSRVVALTGWSE